MIVLWVLQRLADFFVWVVQHMPQIPFPTWLDTLAGFVTQSVSTFVQMGTWLPVGQIATAVGLVLASIGVSLGVKVARIVLSFLTAGGGSAA